jgi:hypothetical protein
VRVSAFAAFSKAIRTGSSRIVERLSEPETRNEELSGEDPAHLFEESCQG